MVDNTSVRTFATVAWVIAIRVTPKFFMYSSYAVFADV